MLGVICYDHATKKQTDLILRLHALGKGPLTIFALPWVERKQHKPLFQHRPEGFALHPEALVRSLRGGMSFKRCYVAELPPLLEMCDRVLIGGCGILPPAVVETRKVVNSHPGFLPHTRGLDALKWAIYQGEPIGVTTHFIGEQADTGILIAQELVNPRPTDSFGSLAWRMWETELRMLVEAADKEPDGTKLLPQGIVRKRMKHAQELAMMETFRWRRNR